MCLYYVFDLHNDPALIAEYERWHWPENIWPEVVESIRAAGIHELDIYRAGNRLVMVLDVSDGYSPQAKAAADAANPRVCAWESMMWKFQQSLPFAGPGEKWVPMAPLFSLASVRSSARN